MSGIDYYELYGVEPEDGEQTPDDSADADSGIEAGESAEGDNADEADTGTAGDTGDTDAADESGAEAPPAETGEAEGAQDGAGNGPAADGQSGQAAQPAGEQPDRAAIEAAAAAKARARMDEIIRGMNLINPRTKQPIQNYSEWEEYNNALQAERRERAMKKLGMNEEQYREFIASDPEVRRAREEAAAARESQARAVIAEQMRQIHELDPSITEVRDLAKMPDYARFYNLVKKNGLSFVDAYKLVNMDKLTRRNTEAQVQAARNAEASKAHLAATKNRGGGDPTGGVAVPDVTEKMYRELFPDMKPAEIRRDYAGYLKKIKKGV